MTKKILIFGAGAIGRGYLGPLLQKHDVELSFVDINRELIKELKTRKSYKAAITCGDHYEIIDVPVTDSFYLDEAPSVESYDLVFCSVGPNNCYDLAEHFKMAKNVISCENDASTAIKLRELTGNKNIYFGIPDVITSNTASEKLLEQDSLMTVTEQGVLVLEKGTYSLPDDILQFDIDELNMHWMCKLFIHNAPHAIVAYLGYLKGYKYIHEAMSDPDIEEIVVGAINEITDGVISSKYATKDFAESYRDKELSRFRNKLLYDTIERVAREPLRKLGKDNRLVLGMRITLCNEKLPEYTAIGAKAALAYDAHNDHEAEYMQSMKKSIGEAEILRKYCGIELFDPLSQYIINRDLDRFIKRI